LGWVRPIHHNWYQWGSSSSSVHNVVSCMWSFWHRAILVGLVQWIRCFGCFWYSVAGGAESVDFLRRIVARGDTHGDPFMDHFPYVNTVIGVKVVHCRFDDFPFNLGVEIIGPVEFVCEVSVIGWKQVVLADVFRNLPYYGLAADL